MRIVHDWDTGPVSLGGEDCQRYRHPGGVTFPDIWCDSCIRKAWKDYQPILADRMATHGKYYLLRMGVPKAYLQCSFDSFEPRTPELAQVLKVVRRWAENPLEGLYLCGPVGTGKTHLGVGAMRILRAKSQTGRFAPVPELLLRCRDSFGTDESLEGVLEDYVSMNLLMLDDLGAENPTAFAQETVGLVVDRAYRNRSPKLIVTSNLDLEELGRRLGRRIEDRLTEICLAVKLSGQSHRLQMARQRTEAYHRQSNLKGSAR